MNYLDRLNPAQLDAVTTTEGPVRVIAGAGTGKTRALTARFCYLADMLGIAPSAVLCVTFTNKAAAEMKLRIRRMLGDFDLGYICTFHSFCVRLLKEDIHVMNFPANFVILDEDDRDELLLKVYADMQLTLKDMPLRTAAEYIARRKNDVDRYIPYFLEFDNEDMLRRGIRNADRLEEVFMRFIYEQKKNYACDFDDIINFTAYILEKHPAILSKWQTRMQYVMVDEFQDVSPRQYHIARMISGAHGNLFIVGDPDQTIYSWRGADVRLLLDFDTLYPSAQTIVLDENYRSTPQILGIANTLIAHNSCRYPKNLVPVSPDGLRPMMYHARSERDEAAWVVRAIRKLTESGVAPGDIAILYRAHFVSRSLEEELMRKEVPHRIYSGTPFYGRQEIKDVICYLRMLVSADDIAFRRTVNNPTRGIGRKRMAFIADAAAESGCSLYEALCANLDDPLLARTGARAYVEAIETARAMVGTVSLGDLMQKLLDMSGYEESLRTQAQWERLDNLAELKRAIEEAGHDDDETLDRFIARTALVTNSDRDSDEGAAVRLMTVHTAKGMEFPYVFVCGLDEGIFPSRRSASPEAIEEERRLAYVAFTRACKGLFLTDAEGFNHDRSGKTPSRFIYEAGTEAMDFPRPLPPQQPLAPLPAEASPRDARFRSGDTVAHPVFGYGLVIEVDEAIGAYVIQFQKLPTARTLRFAAPLTSIDSEKWQD